MAKLTFKSFGQTLEKLAEVLTSGEHYVTWGADPRCAITWFVGVIGEEEPNVVYRVLTFTDREEALHAYHNLSAWVRDVNTSTLEA